MKCTIQHQFLRVNGVSSLCEWPPDGGIFWTRYDKMVVFAAEDACSGRLRAQL